MVEVMAALAWLTLLGHVYCIPFYHTCYIGMFLSTKWNPSSVDWKAFILEFWWTKNKEILLFKSVIFIANVICTRFSKNYQCCYWFGHVCPDVLIISWKGHQFYYIMLLVGDLVKYVKQLKFIRLVMGNVMSVCVCVLAVLRSGTVSWLWCKSRQRRQLSQHNSSSINRHLIQCTFSACGWADNSIHDQFLVQHSGSEYLEGLPLNSLRGRLPVLKW